MMRAEFPAKAKFLFEPHPYKVLHSGRDGTKSWDVAQALLLIGVQRPVRVLCTRETQQSIRESVHQLLADTVQRLGLEGAYLVRQGTILGPGGTEFVFAGLRQQSIDSIKSYEGIDICWVEEAHSVTRRSWSILVPTVRKPGAEIWITFNPELETDETWQRWVLNPPPGTVIAKLNWRDNSWLSELSRNNIEFLRKTDPDEFEHIYEGVPRSAIKGAIFATGMKKALAEGRIGQVPYNPARPVDTAWDLGFGDLTTCWMLQAYDGWYNFVDYHQGEGMTIADHLIELQRRKYVWGTDWLPHDGVDTIIHQRLAGVGDRSMSIEMLLRQAGRRPRIVPKVYVADRINAARTILPLCRFDAQKCADGLQALRHYQWGEPSKDGVAKREPLHDWASHGADGFQGAAVAVRQPKAAPKEPPRPRAMVREPGYAPFG